MSPKEPKTLTWIEMLDKLANATEAKCLAMLEAEKAGAKRGSYLIRIYGKYNALRTTRERAELLKSARA